MAERKKKSGPKPRTKPTTASATPVKPAPLVPNGGLLVARNDGLGARLMPMLNALRLSVLLDLPIYIYWPTYLVGHNTTEVSTLFAEDFRASSFITPQTYQDIRRTSQVRPESEIAQLSGDDVRAAIADGAYFFFDNTEHDVALLDEDPEAVKIGLSQSLPRSLLTAQVAEQMAKIDDRLAAEPPLVYHVRHGDLTYSYKTRAGEWTNKYIPNEIYVSHMRENGVDAKHPAVMIGDCRDSIDWISDHHEGIARIEHMLDTAGLGSLQFDFMELYTMSRARKIIAPEHSGFSKMAARIGNLTVEDVKKSLPPTALKQALENLEKRLWVERNSFTNDGDSAQSILHLRQPEAEVPTVAMDGLIRREIEAASTVPFLFRYMAGAALRTGDTDGLRDTTARAHQAMLADPRVLSAVNAHAAQGLIEAGDVDQALGHLRRACYLTPTVPAMTTALYGFAQLGNKAHLHPDFLPSGFSAKVCSADAVWRVVLLYGFAWETWPLLQDRFRNMLTRGHGLKTFLAHLTKLISTFETEGDTQSAAHMTGLLRLVESYQGGAPEALAALASLADQSDPVHDPVPLQRLAFAHLGRDDKPRALELFSQLVASRPQQRAYHGILGQLLFVQKDFELALHHFDIANPGGADFIRFAPQHIRLLDRQKRPDEAEALFQSLLLETAWNDNHLTHYCRRPLGATQAAATIARLEAVLDEMGKARPVHAQLGALHYNQGDTKSALPHFVEALALGLIPPALANVAKELIAQTQDSALADAYQSYESNKKT